MDYLIFVLMLLGVACGYAMGNWRGFRRGWFVANAEGLVDYPLINVNMEHVRDDIYRFYYMLDDSFIIQGTIAECSAEILGEVDEGDVRKIIFAKISK